MNELPRHTSASQMGTYATCPRKFRFKYLDGAEPEYRSVSLALGSAVHSAIGWWFDQKNAGEKPTLEGAGAIVRADLTAATDEATRYGKWTHEDLEKHAERLVQCFLNRYAELPVEDTEARFDLELIDPDTGEVMPRTMLGYFDFILNDRRVVELKTARSAYSEVDIVKNLQFGGYRHALRQLGIGDEMHVVVILKNKAPRLQNIRLEPDAQCEEFFLRTAADIERAILAGHFPAAPGFGCGGCEYQRRCLGIGEHNHEQAA